VSYNQFLCNTGPKGLMTAVGIFRFLLCKNLKLKNGIDAAIPGVSRSETPKDQTAKRLGPHARWPSYSLAALGQNMGAFAGATAGPHLLNNSLRLLLWREG
jgi:hypothetical protein